jgi:hypothetical protein
MSDAGSATRQTQGNRLAVFHPSVYMFLSSRYKYIAEVANQRCKYSTAHGHSLKGRIQTNGINLNVIFIFYQYLRLVLKLHMWKNPTEIQ